MKTYIEHNSSINFDGHWIPKDPANSDYAQFLQELENREAELVPYTPPAPTWEQIRAQRDVLLAASDWSALPDVTLANKQAWLDYRQALRDIPNTFSNPEDVVWPAKP